MITGRITIEMADASAAEAIIENVRPQLATLRQFVERYDIRSDGPMVIIELVITETQIKTLADMAKAMTQNGRKFDGHLFSDGPEATV